MNLKSLILCLWGIFFGANIHAIELTEIDISLCESRDFTQPKRSPHYPAASHRNYESGKVVLEISINANGCPTKIITKTSSGFPRLDAAAENWAKSLKFSSKDNSTIKSMPISFSIADSTGECIEQARKDYLVTERVDFAEAHERAISMCTSNSKNK